MKLKLIDKLAICTGNSKGIGKAISEMLREEGVEVPNISRTTGYDLTKKEGLEKLMKDYPKCEILINNCGGCGRWGTDSYTTFTEWDEVYQKNAGLAVKLTNFYLPEMTKNQWGRIITISSIYGKEGGGKPWFTMAKAAEIALMKCYANRGYTGVTFNTVCPGFIDVGNNYSPSGHRVGLPEDIAPLVTFLCSNYAKHINGSDIVVDGGETHSL